MYNVYIKKVRKMKKKLRNITIEELNKFCDKQYYADGKENCKNCPLCQLFDEEGQWGLCAVSDNIGTIDNKVLDLEIEVDGK